MQVVLQSASGSFYLAVDPDEGAESIKAKVHARLGVPPYQQQLVATQAANSRALQPGTSLRDLSMVDGDVVFISLRQVRCTGFQLLIRKLDGTSRTLYPSSDCSVFYLKQMISDVMSTLPDHQRLIYAGTRLDDGKMLLDYRITESGCTVDLIPILCRRFSCSMCKGNEIDLRLPNGKVFSMEVKELDVVDTLKAKVLEKTDIPVDHQVLLIGNRRMEEGHTMGEYWLDMSRDKDAPIVVTVSYIIQVFVKLPNGRENPLRVDIYHKVGLLKTQIERSTGFQRDRIHLSLKASGQEIVDSLRLSDYVVHNNAVIMVSLTLITVTLRSLAGRTFKVDVSAGGTVHDLKSVISRHQAVAPAHQRLFFTGRHLENWMSLPTCKIVDGSTVHIVYHLSGPVTIKIQCLGGMSFHLDMDARETILLLKQRIHRLQQIELDEQRLVLDGHLLEDQFTICDYGILNGAVVHVLPRATSLLQLTIVTLSQQTFTVEAEAHSTIKAIKGMVEKKLGQCSWNDLYLFYAGRELHDSRALSYYGITNQSTLFVIFPETNS